MSVKVHRLRSVLDPWNRDTKDVRHVRGATVDLFVPEGFEFIMRNARRAKRSDIVLDGDHITYAADLREPLTASATVFLFGVELFTAPLYVVLAGGAALTFFASKYLLPTPDPAEGKKQSKNYGFTGIGNARAEGDTVPVVYGEMRVGGQIIGEYIKSDSEGSTYHALVCVSEGPVESIGDAVGDTTSSIGLSNLTGDLPEGMEINDNPVENFKDVKVFVRLGSLSQVVVPGWEDTATQFSVALGLVNVETNKLQPPPIVVNETNYYGQSTGVPFKTLTEIDDEWDAWGKSFDLTDVSDRTEIVLQFPRGLTRTSSSGGLTPTAVRFAVRYIELDASNNPITTGGPEGDGYVRLQPTDDFKVVGKTRSPLFHTFKVPLLNAINYTHAVFGENVVCNGVFDGTTNPLGTSSYGTIAALSLPAYLQGNGAPYTNGFSVGGWYRVPLPLSFQGSPYCITWANAAPGFKNGFTIGVQENSDGVPVPYGVFFHNGNATVMTEQGTAPITDMSGGGWHHIVWTYDNAFTEVVCFFDGVQVFSDPTITVLTPGTSGTGRVFTIGNHPNGGSTTAARMDLDEVFFCDRNLSVSEVLNIYNNGEGLIGSTATIPSALAIWRFDSASPFTSEVAAFPNTLVAQNSWALGPAGGGKVKSAGATASSDRMKVRMEVLRISPSSTNSLQQSECDWFALTGILDEEFVYPGRAYYSIEVPASEQLNTSSPKITVPVKGRKVAVWDGVSTSSPVLTPTYTANVAWVALDLVLDQFYGLGAHYKLADVDLQSVLDWANYSDQMVYDLLDRYDAGDRWTNITWTQLTAVTGGVFGELTVHMSSGGYALFVSRYAVGHYIGLTGVNLVNFEVNTPLENTLSETPPTVDGGHLVSALDPVAKTVTLRATLGGDPWTSGTQLSAHVGGTAFISGTIEGREQRHEWNGVLDTPGKGWPTLQGICGIGFAVPIRQGSGLRFKFEQPRSAIDIVNQASIMRDSFQVTYGGASDRPNVKTVDFVDRRLNWERSATRIEHASIQNSTSLTNYRKTQGFALGITSIRQARVYGLFELNVFNDILRQGSFGLSADALPYDVGDILIVGHDLTGWAVSGRIDEEVTGKRVKLDQDVTMVAGSDYEVHIRDSVTGQYEVVDVDHAVHVQPVTVLAQNFITLVANFQGFTPAVNHLYIFVAKGADQPVVVTGWSRNQDLSHTVDWVEYKASIFDFTSLEETTGQESARVSAPNNLLIPPSPKTIEIRQGTTNTAGGYVHTLTVSWRAYQDPDARASKFNVYVQREDRRAAWEKVASTDGSQHSVSFVLDGAFQGEHVSVAVQPMSYSGAGYSPDRSTARRIVVNIVAQKSDAPTGFTADMNGDRSVYSWVSANEEEPLRTIIRRGGWILGQPVGVVAPGIDFLKSTNWASGGADADGRKAPTIYARHINDGGACSDAVLLEYDAAGVSDRTLDQFQREAYEWHRSAWTGADGDGVPPVKTDLAVATDWEGRSYLEFSGSALTASYETSIGTVSDRQKARRCTVEAFAEAMQDFPSAIESYGDFPAAGYELACLTAEGWVSKDRTRPLDCTLRLLISVDGGDFVDFAPGRFALTSATIKMVLTRPNTDYNVRVYRMHTRVRWTRIETTDRSQVQAATEARLFGR